MYFYRPNNFGTKMTEMIRLYIYSIEIHMEGPDFKF